MKIRFKLKFWGTISIVAIVVIIISQLIPYFENKAKHNERLEKVTKALELRERTRISFLNNIEKHYETLSKAYESNNLTQAYNELQLFKKYKKLDYKDITEINKKVMISILEESLKNISSTKYAENLKIYNSLLSLDPTNQIYQQKVAFYEKKFILNSSYLGNFVNLRKQKFTYSKVSRLQVWEDYASYQTTIGKIFKPPVAFPSDGVLKARIKYNEIWTSKSEGNPDIEDNITTVYWLNDQVQGLSYENRFLGNPLTGEGFTTPVYKITELYDRISLFETLEKYR